MDLIVQVFESSQMNEIQIRHRLIKQVQ